MKKITFHRTISMYLARTTVACDKEILTKNVSKWRIEWRTMSCRKGIGWTRGKKTKAASVPANRLSKERNKEEKEKPNLPKIIESRMQPATSFPKTRPFMAMREQNDAVKRQSRLNASHDEKQIGCSCKWLSRSLDERLCSSFFLVKCAQKGG